MMRTSSLQKRCVPFFFVALAMGVLAAAAEQPRRPNIVFIIADDLGYGDTGCYGQTKIRTPNIDRLAAAGMRFTSHYSGNNVCAPSRCVLMTGMHPGHAYIRDNRQAPGFPEGQQPVPAGSLRLPLELSARGYVLGGFGKWGLGPTGSTGEPLRQGFDRWFGFNCQAIAHNYYPTHLWDDRRQVAIGNPKFSAHQKMPDGADADDPASYARYRGTTYAPDLIAQQARRFVRENKDRPFFLYFPTTVPHLALQVPEDSLAEYAGKFPETPYRGDRGYLPHRQPRAAYAAMVTRMDREVGRLVDLVRELGLDEKTLFVFTSDNGPLYDRVGGTDADFFASAAGLRGRKGSFYEGGFRVPCIVRWTGRIAPGTTCDRVTGFEDWLPTLLELADNEGTLLLSSTETKAVVSPGVIERDRPRSPGDITGLSSAAAPHGTTIGGQASNVPYCSNVPSSIDGVSFAPTLLGRTQPPRELLYRESPGYGGQQCVRVGRWKAIRTHLMADSKAKNPPGAIELYDLAADPGETANLASQHPEVVERLAQVMRREHVRSDLFPLRAIDVTVHGVGREGDRSVFSAFVD